MKPGDLLANRFLLLQRAGAGGMGEVYRARDEQTSLPVAVKLLLEGENSRFDREARVLASIDHPAVVRYIAHGTTDTHPWLAMEWLEGCDLTTRLQGEGLTLEESLLLFERMISALAAAHAVGVIHRDVKPSNIFLLHNRCTEARLVDFGIARKQGNATRAITASGVIIGTPGYMAPEQAQSNRTVDARTDFYSLGCVLFHCLTGVPPFRSENVMGLLAQVLLEEAPRVRSIRAELPEQLDTLVAQLLEKDPAKRPSSAEELLRRSADIRTQALRLSAPHSVGAIQHENSSSTGISGGEQRVFCMLLAFDPTAQQNPEELKQLQDEELSKTVAQGQSTLERLLRTIITQFLEDGERAELVGEGSLVCALSGATTDKATRAAQIALYIRQQIPSYHVVVGTGQGSLSARGMMGTVIDRVSHHGQRRQHEAPQVFVDQTTMGLLGEKFTLVPTDGGAVLHGQRTDDDVGLLLGQRTPCVGRERELALLQGTFDEVQSESLPRVVIVTGSVGTGKSRLRREFLQTLALHPQPPRIWRTRCEPLLINSSLSTLRTLVREVFGVHSTATVADPFDRFRAQVLEQIPTGSSRTIAFLGELAGIQLQDSVDPALASARKDPNTMATLLRETFVEFVRAFARQNADNALVIALEDLQWADDASLRVIDHTVRELSQEPVLLLGFARPELFERFPKLWAERNAIELRLAPLGRKACERLVRKVLGPEASASVIASVVDRSAGNPFYLEELLRGTSAGATDIPDSVLATVQARLERLDLDARRILRAASVYGERFWGSSVHALLGNTPTAHTSMTAVVEERLATLCRSEVITRISTSTFAGETEYSFSHALLREAAYTMLTESDRPLGHRLAAQWLTDHGETRAMILAEHWERGEAFNEAVQCLLEAVDQAIRAGDATTADTLIERAEKLAFHQDSVTLSPLVLRARFARVRAEISHLNRDIRTAYVLSREVLTLAQPSDMDWARAAVQVLIIASRLGDNAALDELEVILVQPRPDDHPMVDRARALLARYLYIGDHIDRGDQQLAALKQRTDWYEAHEPATAALIHGALVHRNRGEDQFWLRLEHANTAVLLAQKASDGVLEAMAHSTLATMQADLGHWNDCEHTIEKELLARPERMALPAMTATTMVLKARVLAAGGALDEAAQQMRTAIEFYQFVNDRKRVLYTEALLAAMLVAGGPQSSAQANDCFESEERIFTDAPLVEPVHCLARGWWHLHKNDPAEMERAQALAEYVGALPMRTLFLSVDVGVLLLRVAIAEKQGKHDIALELRAEAKRLAERRLEQIPSVSVREKTAQGLSEMIEALGGKTPTRVMTS